MQEIHKNKKAHINQGQMSEDEAAAWSSPS